MGNILSIQSQVAYGFVGNRVANFTLSRLGNEVWELNTSQFSNHTGYDKWQGAVNSAQLIAEIFSGIRNLGVLNSCDGIVSGYIGSVEIGKTVADIVKEIKDCNPNAIYCFDPVMGDVNTKFFVREEIVNYFKRHLITFADIITPNHFEMASLTDMEINTYADAKTAANKLHDKGVVIIAITSLFVKETKPNHIDIFLSCYNKYYLISTPLLNFSLQPSGTGDLFSSLFLSHFLNHHDVKIAVTKSIESIFGILQKTLAAESWELKLIPAQEELINPLNKFEIHEI